MTTREGAAPSFDGWVAARGPATLRLAYLLTGDLPLAEELVVAALARALPRWPRFPEPRVRRELVRERAAVARRGDLAPDPERTALVLRVHERLDWPELAELLGVREGVARARVERALAGDSESSAARSLDWLAASVPPVLDLAARARSRAAETRRRRRRAVAGAAVALVVAVPVGVLGWTATRGDDGGGSDGPVDPIARDLGNQTPRPARDHHWESYHSVQLQVPDGWASGPLDGWCADGGTLATPRVERPATAAAARRVDVSCEPAAGYGVRLEPRPDFVFRDDDTVTQPHSAPWPDDAWVGREVVGDVQITVATPDRETAERLLASARANDGVDYYGCTPHHDTASGMTPPEECTYDARGDLVRSGRS